MGYYDLDDDLKDVYLSGRHKNMFSTHPYDRWDGEKDMKSAFIEQDKRDKFRDRESQLIYFDPVSLKKKGIETPFYDPLRPIRKNDDDD